MTYCNQAHDIHGSFDAAACLVSPSSYFTAESCKFKVNIVSMGVAKCVEGCGQTFKNGRGLSVHQNTCSIYLKSTTANAARLASLGEASGSRSKTLGEKLSLPAKWGIGNLRRKFSGTLDVQQIEKRPKTHAGAASGARTLDDFEENRSANSIGPRAADDIEFISPESNDLDLDGISSTSAMTARASGSTNIVGRWMLETSVSTIPGPTSSIDPEASRDSRPAGDLEHGGLGENPELELMELDTRPELDEDLQGEFIDLCRMKE